MEMPNYLDYEGISKMNPMASYLAMEQQGLAKQFQEGRQQRQTIDNRSAGLDTLFKEDSYDDRLRQGKSAADLAGYTASDAGVKNRINLATEPLQLDAEQKRLIFQASDSELKQMETVAQGLAYSSDPQQQKEGLRLMGMHRDFVKMREAAKIDAEKAKTQHGYNTSLENLRSSNTEQRQQVLAKAKSDGARGTEKMNLQQRIAHYSNLAFQAQQQGDYEAANMFRQEAQFAAEQARYIQPDPNANKLDPVATVNSGTPTAVPARPVPQPPSAPQGPISGALYPNGQPNPVAQPKQPPVKLTDVQKMYPGIPEAKLREAYKKKFGVDLQ